MKYRIKSLTEKDYNDEALFWNNEMGWGAFETSDTFTAKQRKTLHLPVGNCKWVEVGKEYPEPRYKVTEAQLIKLAQLGYGDPLPDNYKQARKHEIGDGLADFLVIELHEGTEGERDRLAGAIRVMSNAKRQLDAVLMILEDAQSVGIKKAMKSWSS